MWITLPVGICLHVQTSERWKKHQRSSRTPTSTAMAYGVAIHGWLLTWQVGLSTWPCPLILWTRIHFMLHPCWNLKLQGFHSPGCFLPSDPSHFWILKDHTGLYQSCNNIPQTSPPFVERLNHLSPQNSIKVYFIPRVSQITSVFLWLPHRGRVPHFRVIPNRPGDGLIVH